MSTRPKGWKYNPRCPCHWCSIERVVWPEPRREPGTKAGRRLVRLTPVETEARAQADSAGIDAGRLREALWEAHQQIVGIAQATTIDGHLNAYGRGLWRGWLRDHSSDLWDMLAGAAAPPEGTP